MSESPIDKFFIKNDFRAPSIADFRRFLVNCEPRPKFKHIILACGTVIRCDALESIDNVQIKEEYLDMRKEAIINTTLTDVEVNKIYHIISAHNNNSQAEISAILTNQKIWLIHMLNKPYGVFVLNICPGETCEEACDYGVNAYHADMSRPTIVAIITYVENGYDIEWPYGRPDTYHWK
jgi:hypothetical protein